MSPQNVVIAGNFLFPAGSAPAARIQNLASGLEACGASVRVLPMTPFSGSTVDKKPVQLSAGVSYEPLVTIRRELTARNTLFQKPLWFTKTYLAALIARRRVKQLLARGRCDMLIGYGRNMFMLAPLARLCQQSGVVTLLDVVESRSQFHGFGGKLNPIYWDWYLGEAQLPTLFDGIIAIARGLEPVYRKHGATNFLLVPGIEDWHDLPMTHKSPGFEDGFELVYLSALLPRDAPGLLFNAMRILGEQGHDIRLTVLGKFREVAEGRDWAARVEADPVLRRNVQFVGRVDDDELKQRLAQAAGLVLTRRNAQTEICSFPTRLVEYLRYGRPVFVSAVGDIPCYLRDNVDAILLNTDDAAHVAKRIAEVAARPDKGASIGRQGQLRGANCFDREKHAQRILEFAEKLRVGA